MTTKTIGHPIGWPVGTPVSSPFVLVSAKGGTGKGASAGPVDPTWLTGTGTPTIIDAAVTHADENSSVYSDTLVWSPDDGTKVYAEWEIGGDYVIATSGEYRLGMKNSASKLTASNTGGVIFRGNQGSAIGVFNVSMTGSAAKVPNNMPTADERFGPNKIAGMALDGVANKCYFHIDGLWAEDASFGGDPAGDNGWALVGATSTILHLYASMSSNGTTAATATYYNSGLYLPTGYTHLGV